MEQGLYNSVEVKGKCKCLERIKPLEKRSLTVVSYYPHKVWGRARLSYDGRKLLRVCCNKCSHVWKDYNKDSRLWELTGDNPYEGTERFTILNGGKDGSIL